MRLLTSHIKASIALGAVLATVAVPGAQAAGGAAPSVFTKIGPLPITNSMVTGWVVSIALLLLVRWLVGRPSLVPGRGQAVVEGAVGALRDLFEPIVGKKAFPAAFPILIALFFYILIQNWSGLLPGVGTIGWGHHDAEGHFHITDPLIRPANSDWNGTIALAIVAMVAWAWISFKYAGPKVILHDLFGNKADKKEIAPAIYYPLSVVFVLIGVIEIVSICIRPFTLSVRLFGNVFGGESLLHATHFVFPFYFLETLVGVVQAMVFTLLLSIYIGLLCNHGDDHAEEHAHH